MSSTPTKHIDGDVSVGRNVTAGGSATIRGNATVGHNLKVEGWLDAPNIKGPNKGLFPTYAALNSAYPNPHNGWWALVSENVPDANVHIGQVYMADGGAWVAQRNADGSPKLSGNPTVDSSQLNMMLDDVQQDLAGVKNDISGHETAISELRTGVSTAQTLAGTAQTTANSAQKAAETAQSTANDGVKKAETAQKAAEAAQTTANIALPKAIDITALDTMGTDGTIAGILAFARNLARSTAPHTRYAVIQQINGTAHIVGTLDIFSDFSSHVLTQILETHNVFEDGLIAANTHQCQTIFRYYRSFNISAPDHLGVEAGKWTPWRTCEPDTLNAIRESISGIITDITALQNIPPYVRKFGGFTMLPLLEDEATSIKSTARLANVVFDQRRKVFVLQYRNLTTTTPVYYSDWGDADLFGVKSAVGRIPYEDRAYIDTSVNRQYHWNGTDFECIGAPLGTTEGTAYPGDKGQELAESVGELEILSSGHGCVNANAMMGVQRTIRFVEFTDWVDSNINNISRLLPTGTIVRYLSEDGWQERRYIGEDADNDMQDVASWEDIEANGSATGNIINVHEITDNWNFMSRGVAASLVPEKLRAGGRKITFMSAAAHYQTWQFVGVSVEDWSDDTYWKPEVQGVSFNGGETQLPDRDGTINLEYKVEVDKTLNVESENAVSNKAVVEEFNAVRNEIPQGYKFDPDTRQLIISDGNGGEQTVTIPGGGGGGTESPTAVEIIINTPMTDTLKEGDTYNIEFIWRHYNINTGVDTQYGGQAELIVNGSTVDRKDVTQGICTFNPGKWLSVGTNSIRIKVTADDGVISNSPYIKLQVVTLALTSPYLISNITPKGTAVAFRYVVTGSGTKTVRFTLDGQDLTPETITTSGATSVKSISTNNLNHGAHRLTVQAEREMSAEQKLQSNILTYDLIVTEEGNDAVIIAVELNNASVEQYETVRIPYAVYDPTSTKGDAQVAVSLNGTTIIRTTVDRTKKEFSYRAKEHGTLNFIFSSRGTTKEVPIEVKEAATQIEAETDALALYLSSSGRSNDADDADVWEFTSESGQHTAATFSNCGFDTQSGWIKDKNELVALHLEKGATCHIPYNPFATDCKLNGKTIEIEFMVSNCYDTDATVISCLSGNVGFEIKAQEAYISSALKKTVSSKFKQDERIRVGFQVEQIGGNRFMFLFLNGKMSGVVQYDTSDYFVQNPAVGISLGHASCELNVYNIRVYDNALSFRQMVNNYIADMDDTTVMFERLEANNILNDDASETDIDYEKAVQKIPCITFIGPLPTYKGDKKKDTKIIYEDRQHPEYSFSVAKAQNDVQGTSSQYYPRKNWKWKALVEFIMSQSGQAVKKYALRGIDGFGNVVPQKAVKTFCLKADFAESSGTHNTGAANFIHEVLKGAGILTPMQQIDETVRTTIYGFPILMFHQETETSPRKFIGKYNFNNDKSTHDTFGFQDIPGFNKGMVNRDDYLVWHDTLAALQTDAKALEAALDDELMYLIENGNDDPLTNHLVEYDTESSTWKDKGEMWRWSASKLAWTKRDGSSCTREQGILAKVEAGELVENNIECWEFLNNGHPMCLFHQSDYESKIYGSDIPKWIDQSLCPSDENGKYARFWTGAFEPRYPDNDDNNKEYAQGRIPEQLKRVTDWLASLDLYNESLTVEQKKAKGITFAGQVEGYFNKKMMLAYDILRELMVMADQGAKNMMWAIIDGKVYIIFYDNDTIWLINNEGRLIFIPYVEPHSKDDLGKFVFNGESSNLWNLIENSPLQDEKSELFNTMVSQGGMTYERALLWFNTRQSDMWSETIYNADSKYKYIDSFGTASEDGSGATQNYLDIAQGSREEHRKWAMYERFQYENAKYCTGTYRDSYVYIRVNTAGQSSVPSKVEVTLTAAQDWYYGFRFSGNAGYTSEFVKKGESRTFTAPAGSNPNDTECYIHQADRISDLGDLSVLYPTSLSVTQCRMLEQLVVGNKTPGYIGKLANVTLGTHPLLKYINVCNIPTLQTSLDVSGCSGLDEIEAQGSAITSVNLPVGSTISKMHLPETLVQIVFDRLANLTNGNLSIDGYKNVATVNISNCARLNPMSIVDAITSTKDNALQYLRVAGVTLRGSGEELIRLIEAGVRGVTTDSAGNRNPKPEVVGTYEIIKLPTTEMVETIERGIDGIEIVFVVETFVSTIDEVNAESYDGQPEVDTITLDNVGDYIAAYNGETYEEYLQRVAEANRSIHDIIKE